MRKYELEKSIGFAVYEVYRQMRRDMQARMSEDSLTQAQWRALAHLALQEGCSQAVLAERLDIKPITLTRLIDKLAEAGWVKRQPDPEDRRAVRLYLTSKAQPSLEILQEKAMQTREKATRGLNPEEISALLATLKKIKENFSPRN
jgi:MarR family transcriptional regulator for hemolysin